MTSSCVFVMMKKNTASNLTGQRLSNLNRVDIQGRLAFCCSCGMDYVCDHWRSPWVGCVHFIYIYVFIILHYQLFCMYKVTDIACRLLGESFDAKFIKPKYHNTQNKRWLKCTDETLTEVHGLFYSICFAVQKRENVDSTINHSNTVHSVKPCSDIIGRHCLI